VEAMRQRLSSVLEVADTQGTGGRKRGLAGRPARSVAGAGAWAEVGLPGTGLPKWMPAPPARHPLSVL